MAKNKVNGSFCEKWSDTGYRNRLIPTLHIMVAYIAMGFVSAQRGSAFLDIQLITDTTLETASFFFTASAVGGVIGALVFGVLYDRFNKRLVLFSTMVGIAITVSYIPYCSAYTVMLLAWFCNTFFMGGFDASAGAEVVRMWNLECDTYLFLVNCGFSVGALLAPLVTEPFLLPKELAERILSLSKADCVNLTGYRNNDILSENITTYQHELGDKVSFELNQNTSYPNGSLCSNPVDQPEVDIQLHYAYTISAILALVAALPILYQLIRSRKSNPGKREKSEYNDVTELPKRHMIVAVIIVILLFICNSGIEDAFTSFLMTFVVKQLNWSKTQGAQVSSTFFGAYTAVRILGMFFANLFSPTLLMLGSMLILILSVVGIIACSIYSLHVGVWICIGVCGFVIGIIWPIGIAWINRKLVSVSGKVSSFVLVGSATGKLCNPIVLGYFMEEYSPLWFCYIVLFEATLAIVIIVLSTIYSHKILACVRRRTTDMEITVESKPLDIIASSSQPI